MLFSCPRCHGIQCLKLCDTNEKKKGLARQFQLCCSVCLYSHTFFTSKQTDLSKKSKGRSDLNVRVIYGCKQVNAGH